MINYIVIKTLYEKMNQMVWKLNYEEYKKIVFFVKLNFIITFLQNMHLSPTIKINNESLVILQTFTIRKMTALFS